MTFEPIALRGLTLAVALASACMLGATGAAAATASSAGTSKATKSSAAKASGKSSRAARRAPAKPVEVPLPEASPEQIQAAEQVFYGTYDCEFNQSLDIEKNGKHTAYVDVKNGKSTWTMKPVLSSTGAVRLEDVKGETLMVQIASKSMLLNVKTGQRIVDACVSSRQRELMEAARSAPPVPGSEAAPLLQAPGSVPPPPATPAPSSLAPATAPLPAASPVAPTAPASAASAAG